MNSSTININDLTGMRFGSTIISFQLGEYDPFCDDHRLSIQKIAFDASSGQIVVGGRGGQVMVYQLADAAKVSLNTQI